MNILNIIITSYQEKKTRAQVHRLGPTHPNRKKNLFLFLLSIFKYRKIFGIYINDFQRHFLQICLSIMSFINFQNTEVKIKIQFKLYTFIYLYFSSKYIFYKEWNFQNFVNRAIEFDFSLSWICKNQDILWNFVKKQIIYQSSYLCTFLKECANQKSDKKFALVFIMYFCWLMKPICVTF